MAVRSKRIVGPVLVPVNTDHLLYTVPADRTALVKLVTVANTSGATVTFSMGVGGTGAGQQVLGQTNITANADGQFDLVFVFNPGDAVYVRAGTANVIRRSPFPRS